MDADLVFVDEHVPGLRWDANYATWDNFTGKPVAGYLANRIVGPTKSRPSKRETVGTFAPSWRPAASAPTSASGGTTP
jgi:hypothetical protein